MKINEFVLQHLKSLEPDVVIFINRSSYTAQELLEALAEGDEILTNQLAGEFINYLSESKSEPYSGEHASFTNMVLSSAGVKFTTLTSTLHRQATRIAARAYLDDRPAEFNDPVITKLVDALLKASKS
jgi:hypothetical protein